MAVGGGVAWLQEQKKRKKRTEGTLQHVLWLQCILDMQK